MESTPSKLHKQELEMVVPFLPMEQVMELKHLNQLSFHAHTAYPTNPQVIG